MLLASSVAAILAVAVHVVAVARARTVSAIIIGCSLIAGIGFVIAIVLSIRQIAVVGIHPIIVVGIASAAAVGATIIAKRHFKAEHRAAPMPAAEAIAPAVQSMPAAVCPVREIAVHVAVDVAVY